MAYDKKFRRRVIEYKDAGHTFAEVYEAFGVNPQRYYSRKKQLEETGSLEYKPAKERNGNIDKAKLRELADKHPHLVFERSVRNNVTFVRRPRVKCL
jgi:transposase